MFDEQGLTDYEFRLYEPYPKIDFCVQYRESAFAFVSRLLEHVGIGYWFEHEAQRHILVLSDHNAFGKFTTPRMLPQAVSGELGLIQDVEYSFTFRAGRWALGDYDFEAPTKSCAIASPRCCRSNR